MKKLLHTPEGVRDIYNVECGKKLALESRLKKVFHMYGYHDIQTPTFEYFDVFRKEIGTIPSRELYKFFDKEGNTLVLRPDFTPSIARAAATLFQEEQLPIRLCYTGSTFVNHSSYQGRLRETTQMGAELLGDDSVEADAEMLALVIESMLTIGLKEFQLTVSNVDFLQSLIEDADLDEDARERVRELITNRNFYGVEEYLEGDTIRLVKAPDNGKDVFIYKEDKANGIGAWVWIAAGIAVILIPFIREALGTGAVSMVEAVFLLAIGISLIAVQVKEEKKSLNRISARIVEVLKWKEGSKTRGGKPVYTYYPIYEYKRDDVTRRWRGMNGSEQPSQYKTGTRGTLYWRQDDARLMEKEPGRMLRYVGIVLVAAAVICVYGAVVLAF